MLQPVPGRTLAAAAARLMLVAGCVACGANEYAPPPPPVVDVARAEVRDITRYAEYNGTSRAVESVEVRARVKGFLLSMHFEPGEDVEKDDLLFVIDPEPFEVALEAAEAERLSHQAELDLAQTEFERTETMYRQKAVSEIKLVQTRARRDQAAAAVAAAKAKIHAAQLDLDYAHVKAPIRGRVGRRLVDLGNLVGAGEATLLTEVVQYDPLYVYFHVSERDLLAFQDSTSKRRREGGVDFEERPPTPIHVGRSNEEGFPHEGVIDFTALALDSATGTFEVRGVLVNSGPLDKIIVPGTFLRIRLPIGEAENALLVDERALGADQGGRYVLVVDDESKVDQRRVDVGPLIDGMRVIESGLEEDEWIVVRGIQRARPGATVEARREPADQVSRQTTSPRRLADASSEITAASKAGMASGGDARHPTRAGIE